MTLSKTVNKSMLYSGNCIYMTLSKTVNKSMLYSDNCIYMTLSKTVNNSRKLKFAYYYNFFCIFFPSPYYIYVTL